MIDVNKLQLENKQSEKICVNVLTIVNRFRNFLVSLDLVLAK